MTTTLQELNIVVLDDILSHYAVVRTLPDGRVCGVMRLLFHWTVHIDITPWGYEDRYCFMTFADSCNALEGWNGEGDLPGNWHRHPTTGRRRDPATGQIWSQP